jgi:hypothetical protein
VSLAGWLLERMWSEGSGSNPLLELALKMQPACPGRFRIHRGGGGAGAPV